MKSCYISGPITDMPDLNRPAFNRAAQTLSAHGYKPINPFDICADPASWREAMNADIKFLVDCDFITMLPGYERSKGALLELHIATELGIGLMFLPEYQRGAAERKQTDEIASPAQAQGEQSTEFPREPHASAATT